MYFVLPIFCIIHMLHKRMLQTCYTLKKMTLHDHIVLHNVTLISTWRSKNQFWSNFSSLNQYYVKVCSYRTKILLPISFFTGHRATWSSICNSLWIQLFFINLSHIFSDSRNLKSCSRLIGRKSVVVLGRVSGCVVKCKVKRHVLQCNRILAKGVGSCDWDWGFGWKLPIR